MPRPWQWEKQADALLLPRRQQQAARLAAITRRQQRRFIAGRMFVAALAAALAGVYFTGALMPWFAIGLAIGATIGVLEQRAARKP